MEDQNFIKPTTLDPETKAAGFVADGHGYPNWTEDQKKAIAYQAEAFNELFWTENPLEPDPEVDRSLRILYDLVHGF